MVSNPTIARNVPLNDQRRYQDHLAAHGNTKSKAYIMTGGVKAWLEKFSDAEDLVDKDPAI